MCVAVNGRFLHETSVDALRVATEQARREGLDIVFLEDGPLGDAITLAAALGALTDGILLGVRGGVRRHPAMVAREMTTLDLVSRGRAVLAFVGPFSGATAEAIGLCRGMWREGIGIGVGPHYPVPGAVNRPGPFRAGGPPVALDATDGLTVPTELLALCDMVLVPAGSAPPAALPHGVDVCQIQGA
jgi:alkanesulfonate monooxygenase SsuD/methylene tetrahydromethanopterin reductase-like flavin-dependent oxidoreductase (luciferase family)